LYRDTSFRSIVDEIEKSQPEEVVYPSSTEQNSDFKRGFLNQVFFERETYTLFPAFASIVDTVYKQGNTKSSAKISIFYAMKYREYKENDIAKEVSDADYRRKWKLEHRCEDGHYVRSKNEQLVDNWLYHHGVVHAYEKLVIDQLTQKEYIPDFYLPVQDAYIEVWGYETKEYQERREKKKIVYKRNGLRLIDMTGEDVKNLDDFLRRNVKLEKT